jgi:hypothetical protein
MSESHYNDGGTAFPVLETDKYYGSNGMSLRDYFAGQALEALIVRNKFQIDMGEAPVAKQAARDAYWFADAMLKAREAK